MTTQVPPKKNTAYSFEVALTSQADTDIFQTSPTLATGDVTVSKDGDSFTNIGTLPSEIASTGVLTTTLTTDEMNADRIAVLFHDAAGDEWQDLLVTIHTVTTNQMDDLPASSAIADAVWDELLTGAAHNTATSAGRRLRDLAGVSITSGTAQSGTDNSVVLEDGEASTTDNIYNQNLIAIIGGTGAGQCRLITEYDGDTLTAMVDREWDVNPSSDSEYQVIAFSGILLTDHGTATAGAASTITLASTASAVDDVYIGSMVVLSTSTGAGQARLITDYDGTGKVATVSPAWTTEPDETSVYKIIPVGRAIVDSVNTTASQAVADEVLKRGVSNVEDTADATSLAALVLAAFESALAGTTWTIYKTDHSTTFTTRTVVTDSSADPIIEVT
jgi:hypothetical protein